MSQSGLEEQRKRDIKPINLSVKKSTEIFLRKLAKEYGYLYGGSSSLSKFLDGIGDGELLVTKPGVDTSPSDGYHINFKMWVKDYIGVLSETAKIFNNHHVNIIGIETASRPQSEDNSRGYCDVIAHVKDNSSVDIKAILLELKNLTLEQVWDTVKHELIERELNDNNKDDSIKIEQNLTEKETKEIERKLKEKIERKLKKDKGQERIVDWCRCSAAMLVTAQYRPGLFFDITETIAKKHFGILSTQRKTHEGVKAIYYFHLNIESLENFRELMNAIEEYLKDRDQLNKGKVTVEQIKIDEMITRFQRINVL
jgi:glycine cleavage system regulatory protein